MTRWSDIVDRRLAAIRDADRWREVRTRGDNGLITFASNDYLGLTRHPAVVAAAHDAIERWGTGAGASRLVVGNRPVHDELEAELADWNGTEAALVFASGYAANVGVLTAVASAPEVLVVSDELNHASIIDGCRLSRGTVTVVRHRDVDQVAALLSAHRGPAVVVADAVFSMDGDEAPVEGLAAVCRDRGALLILDEAHAVLGPSWEPPAGLDLLRVGTLSKSLGALGGFVAGDRRWIDLLVNTSRPFIFSTGLAPADAAAALAAVRVVRSAAGESLTARLRGHVARVAPGHPSPIVPVVLGDEHAAIAAAEALLARGLLVPPIRPPTVPPGTSRLRIALSAAHTDAQVDRLLDALTAL
ncbi:MAG: aminotransferase class I/II-fold pyridoxal phosphate-dependent enzyme [Acidimicrobiales bacterium]